MSNLDSLPVVITDSQFQELFGQPVNWVDFVTQMCLTLPMYNIVTPARISMFLAQVGHESEGFTHTQENLNYSAAGLLATFPSHFNLAQAAEYSRQPERIANRVYALRGGNGDETSGDGWKFRGSGLIQLTFKDNYQAFSRVVYSDDRLVTNPSWVRSIQGAVTSACWFWQTHGLNEIADAGDILHCTKIINGGTIGLVERTALWNKIKAVYAIG